jgi:hypothetical protein
MLLVQGAVAMNDIIYILLSLGLFAGLAAAIPGLQRV